MFLENEEGLIGKYSLIEKTITYFHNSNNIEILPLENVTKKYKQIALEEKSKVYWFEEEEDAWLSGIFLYLDETVNDFLVWISEEYPIKALKANEIYLRSKKEDYAISDFIDAIPERAKSVDSKIQFLKNYIGQVRSADGLATVLSTPVGIYEHQIRTVSTVTKDPVKRYLLADEVGLGKTIQTGLILKQFIYENGPSKILIITPKSIKLQWIEEFEKKIGLDRNNSDITFLTFENLKIGDNKFDYLVIDEAHRVNHLSRNEFFKISKLTKEISNLLLLTATPPIGNEEEYLKMMHLIDPDLYDLEDKKEFKNLIVYRSVIGGVLNNLNRVENKEDFEYAISSLEKKVIDSDNYLKEIIEKFKNLEEGTPSFKSEIEDLKETLVFYLSEFYKLNRRMIRNKRSLIAESKFKTVGRTPPLFFGTGDKNLTYSVENWLTQQQFEKLNKKNSNTINFCLNAFASSHLIRNSFITERLNNNFGIMPSTSLVYDKPENLLNNEKELLENILKTKETDTLLFSSIIQKITENFDKKTVVYSQYTENIKHLENLLTKKNIINFKTHIVDSDEKLLVRNFEEFRDQESMTHVLLADASIEEGKNLQFVDRLICIDFPFEPLRVEQLIGRFDRWKGNSDFTPVKIEIYKNELLEFWVEVLKHGFGIFQKSISSVQFNLETAENIFHTHLLNNGFTDLDELVKNVDSNLKEEKKKIELQDLIDSYKEKNENKSFQKIAEFEDVEDGKIEGNRYGLQKWIQNLGFFHKYIPNSKDIFLMGHEFIRQPKEDKFGRIKFNNIGTFVNKNFYIEKITKSLAREISSGSYSRSQLLNYSGFRNLRLFRYGDNFIDQIYFYTINKNSFNFNVTNRVSAAMSNSNSNDLIFLNVNVLKYLDENEVNNSLVSSLFPPTFIEYWYQVDIKNFTFNKIEDKNFINEFLQGSYVGSNSNKYQDFDISRKKIINYFSLNNWNKITEKFINEINKFYKNNYKIEEKTESSINFKIKYLENLKDVYKNKKLNSKLIKNIDQEIVLLENLKNVSKKYSTNINSIRLIILSGSKL